MTGGKWGGGGEGGILGSSWELEIWDDDVWKTVDIVE